MRWEDMKKGQIVQLNIPESRPIKTLDGNLHEAKQDYKVLGGWGSFARLSRKSDCAKLIVEPSSLFLVGGAK